MEQWIERSSSLAKLRWNGRHGMPLIAFHGETPVIAPRKSAGMHDAKVGSNAERAK